MAEPSTDFPQARALALVAALVGALAIPASARGDEVVAGALAQPSAEVREYWTEERMASARPGSDLLAGVQAPNPLLDDLLGALSPTPRRGSADLVSNPEQAPFRTHGKVFLTLDGVDYVCSATVVRARTKRLVVSAGHCVFGFGQFATNWMFIPGKDGADEPYGRWIAGRLATTPQWQASEDLRYDVGMATMRRRNGKRLQNVVGARGIAFNQGRDLRFRAFGYPAEAPFNGNQLYRCNSPAQGHDQGPPPQPTRIDCDMTGGSSGGGWVMGRGRVNSVISYGYECVITDLLCQVLGGNPEEGKLFGPYFGATIKKLYRSERRRR